MRSHDRHVNIALKPRKRKPSSSRKKSNESLARSSWPKGTISRGKKAHGSIDNIERRSSPEFSKCPSVIDTNDSANVLTCDIVELFCENGDASHVTLEERTTCTRISSSTELEEKMMDVCSMCKDCAECQLQDSVAKMREVGNLMNERDEEHLEYYENEVNKTASTSSTVTSTDYEAPILVDLTSEESKITWKQTILKRFGDGKSLEMSGENAINTRKRTIGSVLIMSVINLYLYFSTSVLNSKHMTHC